MGSPGIDKLKRVMWRVTDKHPKGTRVSILVLRKALMFECGTEPRTIDRHIKTLKELGWIKLMSRYSFRVLEYEDDW